MSASGSALIYPAAALASYPFIFLALFIMGLGFAMLQIAANPYVTILGPERTASSRLNLSQGFNSFGTTIGPIIGGWLIFPCSPGPARMEQTRSRCRTCALGQCLCCWRSSSGRPRAGFHQPRGDPPRRQPARYAHTVFGIVAIFMYVGGEVTVGSRSSISSARRGLADVT